MHHIHLMDIHICLGWCAMEPGQTRRKEAKTNIGTDLRASNKRQPPNIIDGRSGVILEALHHAEKCIQGVGGLGQRPLLVLSDNRVRVEDRAREVSQ